MLSKSRHGTHLLLAHRRNANSQVLASLESATPRSHVHDPTTRPREQTNEGYCIIYYYMCSIHICINHPTSTSTNTVHLSSSYTVIYVLSVDRSVLSCIKLTVGARVIAIIIVLYSDTLSPGSHLITTEKISRCVQLFT